MEGDLSLEDLNEGMKPGQSMLFNSGTDYNSDPYAAIMKRSMKKASADSSQNSDD